MPTIEDRVRELIQTRGESQANFADQIGLDPTKLSKSLHGTRRFSSFELAMIASHCHVSVDFLMTGQLPAVAKAARASAGSSTATALELAHEYAAMRADLVAHANRHQAWRLPAPVALRGRWIDQGQELAAQALDMVNGAGRSTKEPPWELIPDVFGIDVAVQDLGDGFDGLAVATAEARLILANVTPLPARQRFTIAHELGHLLASDDQQIHSDEDIFSSASKRGESETRANAFAAAFLMPPKALTAHPPTDDLSFCRLATTLQVSPSALAYRLENLGLIDPATCESWRGISAARAADRCDLGSEWPARQAESLTRRAPSSLLRDTYAAYRAGETTLRPYAGLLGIEPARVRSQLAGEEPES